MQKTFSKKRSSSSKTRKNNRRIKKMKNVVGSGASPAARDGEKSFTFMSVFTLFIIALGIMANIANNANVPNNALTHDAAGIHVSQDFASKLNQYTPNNNLKLLPTEDENTLLLENTPDNIKIFKDSLKSFAEEYITDKNKLEIVNREFAEYEKKIGSDNFSMGNLPFGGKKSK